jgi:nitrate reductase alpha subunit
MARRRSKPWVGLRKTHRPVDLQHLSLRRQGERIKFDDLTVQPRKIITSPDLERHRI